MTTRYRYRAATSDGRVVEGVLQAPSESTALGELRRQRLYPVDLAPLPERRGRGRARSMARTPALALLARTVATMLGAGVTLDRALALAARQVPHPGVAAAVRQLRQDLQGGAGLAEAMGRHAELFGPTFIAMAAAGEESGALDESMTRLADHLDEMVELQAQIRSALVYPALMALTSFAGTVILLFFVVPRFAVMLEELGGTLPLSTRLLVGASELVLGGWWLMLLVGAALVAAGRSWLSSADHRRRLHAWRLAWPIVGELELRYATARFTRVLGMLLRSGRPMLPALRVARGAVSNTEIAARLERAAEAVRRGQRVHEALEGTLPPLAAELVAVGEESGRLDEMCLRIAETFDQEVRRALRTAVAVIEPALILLFGAVVAFVALAMLQAIYGMNVGLQ